MRQKMIAYCGLVCTDCPANIATQANDRKALEQLAQQWSKEYSASLDANDCLCDGCKSPAGRKIAHWNECQIKLCANGKNLRNCAHCSQYSCDKLEDFFTIAPEAKETLNTIRQTL